MLIRRALIYAPCEDSLEDSDAGLLHEVLYLQFPGLWEHKGIFHAVCTRHGGVSPSPYHTLNTSSGAGDSRDDVKSNLLIIKEGLDIPHLLYINQVHGKEVLILREDDARDITNGAAEADAIITDARDVAIMVKLADCQGVILYDAQEGVISIVHCGWRGNVGNILGHVVGRMQSEFGSRPAEILAAISPSLGPCCAEFITYREIFPASFTGFMVRENYFDLWEISRSQLLEAGLKGENVEVAGLCTRCRTDLFYSYRGEGITGRFAALVMLKRSPVLTSMGHAPQKGLSHV